MVSCAFLCYFVFVAGLTIVLKNNKTYVSGKRWFERGASMHAVFQWNRSARPQSLEREPPLGPTVGTHRATAIIGMRATVGTLRWDLPRDRNHRNGSHR